MVLTLMSVNEQIFSFSKGYKNIMASEPKENISEERFEVARGCSRQYQKDCLTYMD